MVRHDLLALRASDGTLIPTFGNQGHVDLREGFERNPEEQSISATSPGIVYKDLLVLGSLVGEDLPASPGDIRAFDVRTGKIRWTFHTLPHPGEFGYETWPPEAWKHSDAANNWCGMSVDQERGLVIIPMGSAAFDFYGTDRLGDDLFANCVPALVGIAQKRNAAEIVKVIREGAGLMPAFARLDEKLVRAMVRYVMDGEEIAVEGALSMVDPLALKYAMDGYNKFLDPDGYPAVTPPWGTLNAINLNTGKYAWSIPFGEYPELAAKGLRNTGSENYGGPMVTAGGLLFIGATVYDRKFHAYDKLTGKLLWETLLPAGGTATPATYAVQGRQFVVIAAGGGKCGTASGGTYQAFALSSKIRQP